MGRARKCDCGCRRPAEYFLVRSGKTNVDLGFSRKCIDKFNAACEYFNVVLEEVS